MVVVDSNSSSRDKDPGRGSIGRIMILDHHLLLLDLLVVAEQAGQEGEEEEEGQGV